MAERKKKTLWNLVDNLEGDKVVWIIVLMLILFSIVCIFSSTSRLLSPGETRIDIVKEQLLTVAIGMGVIIFCYKIPGFEWIRKCSRWGFVVSMAFLLFLNFGPHSGPIRPIELNGAVRAISFFGKQIFVYELVKVAMVMYLAWALENLSKGEFKILDKLAEVESLGFLGTKAAKKVIYIYLPFAISTVFILPGSNSAALFIGGIMFLTIMIGGSRLRDVFLLGFMGLVLIGGCLAVYKVSDGKVFNRIGTAISRTGKSMDDYVQDYKNASNYRDRQKAIDKLRQPYSARIAIKQGGILGKGPGQSTQRYAVPDISEDYMFSFIIEEYGLIGGILVIILYVSLLARGAIIVRNCGKDMFAKTSVAGLSLMITGQAFLHMFVNADIGPMTGQTLPLISHGTSAFLCFCIAFGIILSISKAAARRVEKEQREAESLMPVRENLGADFSAEDTMDIDELS